MGDEDTLALASVLLALADPVRLRLLSVVAPQGEVCSCHLQELRSGPKASTFAAAT